MSLHSRLRRLEVLVPTTDPLDAIEQGTATLKDFGEVYKDGLELMRTIVAAQADRFRLARARGVERSCWFPQHVAARIVSVPVDTAVDRHLVDLLAEHANRRPWRTAHAPAAELRADLWRSASLLLVVIGGEDGLPLRRAIAAGRYSDADDKVRSWGHARLLQEGAWVP